MAIRLVPSDPGPEFRAAPWPCDSRPSRCGECAVGDCPYGEEPGIAGPPDSVVGGWGRHGITGARRPADLGPYELTCPICPSWAIKAPDLQSAAEAYRRHMRDAHPDPGAA